MRKIVVSEFVSADGVMEAPDAWQFPFQTEELGAITEGQIRDADAFLRLESPAHLIKKHVGRDRNGVAHGHGAVLVCLHLVGPSPGDSSRRHAITSLSTRVASPARRRDASRQDRRRGQQRTGWGVGWAAAYVDLSVL